MKYYLVNPYNKKVSIRNTELRLIRYIRNWNLTHKDRLSRALIFRLYTRIDRKEAPASIIGRIISYMGFDVYKYNKRG